MEPPAAAPEESGGHPAAAQESGGHPAITEEESAGEEEAQPEDRAGGGQPGGMEPPAAAPEEKDKTAKSAGAQGGPLADKEAADPTTAEKENTPELAEGPTTTPARRWSAKRHMRRPGEGNRPRIWRTQSGVTGATRQMCPVIG
jgi:hypothetical protein